MTNLSPDVLARGSGNGYLRSVCLSANLMAVRLGRSGRGGDEPESHPMNVLVVEDDAVLGKAIERGTYTGGANMT